jgi:hypothetical protein
MSKQQKPSVNRMVHYYAEGNSKDELHSGPFAAMITKVDPPPAEGEPQTVSLSVFYPASGRPEGEEHQKTGVKQSAEPTKHHWCWPKFEV